MSTKIDASWETLIRQASMVMDDFLDEAIIRIDNKFGEGFAKANPGLVGDLVKSTSVIYAGDVNVVGSQWVAESLSLVSDNILTLSYVVGDLND